MGLFKELVLSAPVGNRLQFGHTDNVRILKLDTSVHKKKGLPINQHIFITLVEIDPKTNAIISQSEGSYWDLDSASDFLMSNFIDEFTSLGAMVEAYDGDLEAFETDILSACPEDKEISAFIKNKGNAKKMQDSVIAAAEKHVKPHVGINSKLLKCKITTNKKGYFELGKEMSWLLPMDSEEDLSPISLYEKRVYRDSLKIDNKKQEKPDKPGEKQVSTSSFSGL